MRVSARHVWRHRPMARCSFCGRDDFKSSQSVRAHLRFCPVYKRRHPPAPPRARRARTEEEDLRRLFGPAAPSRRPSMISPEVEPQRNPTRAAPSEDSAWTQEEITQEVRRQWRALQEADRKAEAAAHAKATR